MVCRIPHSARQAAEANEVENHEVYMQNKPDPQTDKNQKSLVSSLIAITPTVHRVGMKCLDCSCCSLNDWGNAAMAATMPTAMNPREIMDQMTPQQREEPPYLCAKTLASEVLTLRRMRSSHCSH